MTSGKGLWGLKHEESRVSGLGTAEEILCERDAAGEATAAAAAAVNSAPLLRERANCFPLLAVSLSLSQCPVPPPPPCH